VKQNSGGSARGRGSRTDHCSGILPNRWWSTLRASMAAEALRSSGFTTSASLRSSAGFHDARGRSTAPGRRGPAFPRLLRLPPPRTAVRRPSATPVGAGSRCPRASSLPPTPLPSSFPLSSSSLVVDRAKSPSGGGGQGVAGVVGFIGRRPRVSRQMDGRRAILGIRASATRRASRGAGVVGQRPWGRSALPPRCRHGETEEGEKKTGKGADRWGPPVSGCGVLGRWELGCGLRWAERPNGLAV
jgi:hypothetical protein